MSYSRSFKRAFEFSFSTAYSIAAATTITTTHQGPVGYAAGTFYARSSASTVSGTGQVMNFGVGGKIRNTLLASSKSAGVNIKIGGYPGMMSRQIDSVAGGGISASGLVNLEDIFYDPGSGLISFQVRNTGGTLQVFTLYYDGTILP
jgi:hypothetical protein